MKTIQKILVIGDAVAPTGFSRVIHEVISPMCHEYDIYQMGVNYQGGEHNWGWKLYRAHEKENPFGFDRLAEVLQEVEPHLIFMLGDDVILARWMNIINKWDDRKNCRVVIYCPVDSTPVIPSVLQSLSSADRLVTFTEFGRNCFYECRIKAAQNNVRVKAIPIEVMPHGVSTADFHPLENDIHYHLSPNGRLAAKQNLFGNNPQFNNSFIVLNANRNQERKRQDITIRGFAQFAAGKPDNVKLYLHCGVKDLGWNLIDLAQREGIADRLILSTDKPGKPALTNAELNRLFNVCDVGINTSSSEGWGLVSFEHAAAGAAQVIPAHTGVQELWTGHAEMLTPSASITDMDRLTEQYIISPQTVADALERLYVDKEYLTTMSIIAHKNATRADYSWSNISNKWLQVFREELDKLPIVNTQFHTAPEPLSVS